ncbi:MAG: VOC family protein [Acidimicrobiales bacterium]|jgi:predicted 3-demethylubiquinone-9 3-methyltransferase (glyoxalase superfamily)
MPRITPSFLFASESRGAAEFYVTIFPNSKITRVNYYNEAGPMPAGTVLAVDFQLDGQDFTAINSGAAFEFNESISFRISCESQEDVDYYWHRLGEGGEESSCGWLSDRYGVHWQIVPTELERFLGDPDPERAERAMAAMLQMRKLDLAVLQAAVDQIP